MARDANKTKTKAKINWGWDAPENRTGKATRRTKSKNTIRVTDDVSIKVKRKRGRKKKLGVKAILIILLVTIIGAGIGVGACYFVGRNDCFEIIGNDEITLTLRGADETEYDETNSYIDEGVKVISLGKDISKNVVIETNLTLTDDGKYVADEVGTYYIIYKTNDIKYGKIFTVQRIRLITFVESEEPDIDVDRENTGDLTKYNSLDVYRSSWKEDVQNQGLNSTKDNI